MNKTNEGQYWVKIEGGQLVRIVYVNSKEKNVTAQTADGNYLAMPAFVFLQQFTPKAVNHD